MSYSPTIGRWIQTDPGGYADGLNLQEYVRSNPPNFLDPMGLKAKPMKPQKDGTFSNSVSVGGGVGYFNFSITSKDICNPDVKNATITLTISIDENAKPKPGEKGNTYGPEEADGYLIVNGKEVSLKDENGNFSLPIKVVQEFETPSTPGGSGTITVRGVNSRLADPDNDVSGVIAIWRFKWKFKCGCNGEPFTVEAEVEKSIGGELPKED